MAPVSVAGRESGAAEDVHSDALAMAEAGDLGRAADRLRHAIVLEPLRTSWYLDLAALLCALDRWSDALVALEQAAALEPLSLRAGRLFASALRGVGRASRDRRDWPGAVHAFERSLSFDSRCASAHRELAYIFGLRGFHHLGLHHRKAVLDLEAVNPSDLCHLARAQLQTGDVDGCLESGRQLLDGGAGSAPLHSEFLSISQHRVHQTAESIRQAHEQWAITWCSQPSQSQSHANDRDPHRPIRIGYVTGEFFRGPASHFLLPLLAQRDRCRFEVTCYHTNPAYDERTAQFQSLADCWRNSAAWTDAELSEQIRSDRIDMLVDLSGHYDHNRLTLFALRPAPVQATFPNYPSTTGVPAIDYIFSDRWVCPPGSDNFYTEEVYRLPSGYLPYSPPSYAPEVSPLPALRSGTITFGVFQRPAKFNVPFWDAVAEILRARPDSRLLIHYNANELDDPDSLARSSLLGKLEARGVDRRRISFRGPLPAAENLALLGEADIALDTFPYNGQTTTCECLWMGVPVITLTGETHVSRVGFQILDRLGLRSLAAHSVPKYVETALQFSGDLAELRVLRDIMRSRMQRSPLLSGQTVADIEQGFRWMWQRWCAKEPN